MDTLRTIMGERIRSFRKTKKYSIEELAHQAGMNPAHVAKIERGVLNFTVGSLEKLLNALEVSYQDFFQFDDPVPAPNNPIIDKTVNCMRNLSIEEQKHLYKTAAFLYQKRDSQE